LRGSHRSTGLLLAAICAVSGCGSDHGGATNNQNKDQYTPSSYAYVASAGPNPGSAGAVYEYAVGFDGTVSPLAQPSIAAGINPSALVVVGNGRYVYVVNAGDGTISQYRVAADATLTPMSPATVTNPGMQTFGTTGGAATVDLTESYLYVVNTADDDVAQFSIGGDGQLTPLTPATVATGVAPVSIVAGSAGFYVLNSGASGEAGSVSQYTQAADGTLALTNATPVAAGTNPTVFAVDEFAPSFAFGLSNCDGTQCLGSIRQFAVGANGALTATGSLLMTGSHDRGVGMVFEAEVSGGSAYVLVNEMGVDTESGALLSFQVDSSGALTATSPASLSAPGVAVALVESLQYGTLYVLTTNAGANANTPASGGSLSVYSEGNGGTPTLLGTTGLLASYPSAVGIWVLLPP
jgi:6-phosphogluconolactonase (cycloisomerase 2 family)